MSKQSIVERITSGTIGGIISLMNTLITLITFITVDPQSAGKSLGMDSFKPIYFLYSLFVGLTTYGILFMLKIYVQKVIAESFNDLNEVVNTNIKLITKSHERHFISAIISIERLPVMYPQIGQSNILANKSLVQDEIKRVRENVLSNRKAYKISLDTLEEQLELIYGPYYDYRTENEPN